MGGAFTGILRSAALAEPIAVSARSGTHPNKSFFMIGSPTTFQLRIAPGGALYCHRKSTPQGNSGVNSPVKANRYNHRIAQPRCEPVGREPIGAEGFEDAACSGRRLITARARMG